MPRPSPLDMVLLLGTILLALLLAGPLLTIPLRIPINYDEGWNAAFDARAAFPGLGPLYPGPDSLVFNNYPPLGFLVVGCLARFVFGDMIVTGRIVALAALLAAAALTGLCVRRLGGTRGGATATALLLMLLACSFYRGYVAMDDPQWLAQALMLGGLAMLLRGDLAGRLRRGDLPWPQILGSALLMVAGGFVKHSLVALPAATTLWLAWLDRRAALAWAAAVGSALALGMLLTWAWFGAAAFADVLRHHRVVRLGLLIHAASGVAPLLPMLAVVVLRVRLRPPADSEDPGASPLDPLKGGALQTRSLSNRLWGLRPQRTELRSRSMGRALALLFIALSLLVGIAQRCGEGVNYNAHFESLVALCLGFGLAITPKPDRTTRRPGPAALCVFAALPVLVATPWTLPAAWQDVAARHARQAAWRPIIARLADADGLVGCEMQSLCAWAGRPFTVDVFNLTQSALTRNKDAAGSPGDDPAAVFQRMVARHRFTLFEVQPRSATHAEAHRLDGGDPVMDAFDKGYAQVGTGPGGALLLAPLAVPAPAASRPLAAPPEGL